MAEDALAKARAIAAKLSGGIVSTDLGKRKNRWDDDPSSSSTGIGGLGLGATKKKKVYIPVNEHPGINFLGLLIGPRGATQKQMQESSGAKIVIRGRGSHKDSAGLPPHPDDDDDLHVSIEGTDDAIEKAYRDVQEILYNPEQASRLKENQLQSLAELNGRPVAFQDSQSMSGGDVYQIELRVPNSMVGLVIGKGGENIHKMQSQTGAHMQIAKETDMKPGETLRSIWLKGSPSAVAELKIRVDEVINARMNPVQQQQQSAKKESTPRELDHAFIIKIPVPNDKVGVVIGKGGMTIKAIQERTRATVQIPPGPDEDNPQVRTLSIGADSKESADAAQMEIFMALQVQQQQSQQQVSSLSNALHIAVPDDKVGLIIGKGGMTIKDIQTRTKVRIQIPQSADPNSNPPIRTLTIVGSPECQHLARYEIELVVSGQNQSISGVNNNSMMTHQSTQQQGYYPWGAQPQVNPYGMPYQAVGAGGTTAYTGYAVTPTYGMQNQATGYYGSISSEQQQQQYGVTSQYNNSTSSYYGQQDGTQISNGAPDANTSNTTISSAEIPSDPTAFYNDFWLYSSYYGEAAARVYYGAWSPPENTPPPPGVVVADPSQPPPQSSEASTSSTTTNQTSIIDPNNTSATTTTSSSNNGNTETLTESALALDPETARQWEEYKKQYNQWYEEHGKAAGADPNPPPLQ